MQELDLESIQIWIGCIDSEKNNYEVENGEWNESSMQM